MTKVLVVLWSEACLHDHSNLACLIQRFPNLFDFVHFYVSHSHFLINLDTEIFFEIQFVTIALVKIHRIYLTLLEKVR